MIGIYSRDNLAGQLGGALDAALARRQAAVDRSAAYRNNNVKAATDFLKSIGRYAETSRGDELDQKLESLEAELAEAQAEQAEKERLTLLDRSLTAAQGMTDYRPAMAQGQLDYQNAMSGQVMRPVGGYDPRVGGSQYTVLDYMDAMKRRGLY